MPQVLSNQICFHEDFHHGLLSLVFRGQFLDLLKKAFARNKLLFVGQTASWADSVAFNLLIDALQKKPWIVYAKKPFGSPVQVLDYLGRYTHRVALSNDRILSAHSREVTFSYRDRKNENRKKTMTLDAHEFIRRFLLHLIPKGFVRVRHSGVLANRSRWISQVNSNAPRSSPDHQHGDVCSARCQGYNPHRQPPLLHPTL